jgi:hypothetical protein
VRRAGLPGDRLAEVINLAERKHAALAIAQRPRAVASLETMLVLCRRLLADGAEPTLENVRLLHETRDMALSAVYAVTMALPANDQREVRKDTLRVLVRSTCRSVVEGFAAKGDSEATEVLAEFGAQPPRNPYRRAVKARVKLQVVPSLRRST